MNPIVSPYALLQASKPRPPHTMTTTYDLYSAAYAAAPADAQARESRSIPTEKPPRFSSVRVPTPSQTHYISDIQKRHNAAIRRTALR